MTTSVVILRAAGGFASRFARLKNAWKAFFNALLSRPRGGSPVLLQSLAFVFVACYHGGGTPLHWRRKMRRLFALLLAAQSAAVCTTVFAAELTAEKTEHGVTIKVGEQLFAEYLTRSGAKPVVWPILGPTGKAMTRAYPMESVPGEKRDHIHQRSLWFTHGEVNGVDFWSENDKHGTTEHREFVKVAGGPTATIVTRNDWLGSDGQKILQDERTLVFGADDAVRWIDFGIVLSPTEKAVEFGDTKEGTFGVRVPTSMDVDSKQGGKIVNSRGDSDAKAWSKEAEWVDYHGPVDGEQLGIAILNHPSSYAFPTRWHVRTYGLFAANPFAGKGFELEKSGGYRLEPGKSLTLRYRVILHRGDEQAAGIQKRFEEYAQQK
jgi:hypothetical protein